MAPPNHHRSVRYEEDDFDDVTKTALEMEQEQRMVYVMRDDLSKKAADDIKYGYEGRLGTSTFVARRHCDKADTKEAEVATQNKSKLAGWTSFHTTVDDADLPDEQPRNLHSHRAGVQQGLRLAAVELGLSSIDQLDLNDTYVNLGGDRKSGKLSFRPRKNQPKGPIRTAVKHHTPSLPYPPKAQLKNTRGQAKQTRDWPPAALAGSLGVAAGRKPPVSTVKSVTERLAGMPAGGQLTPKVARVKPQASAVSRTWSMNLVDPSDFMSAAKGMSSQEPKTTNNHSEAAMTHGAQEPPTTSSVEAAQENTRPQVEDPAIRRVPVQEFSIPAIATLAPGEVSTHTDGAPSPGTFSGFSAPTEVSEQVSVQTESLTNDLIGLGIGNVDLGIAPELMNAETSLAVPAQVNGFSPSLSIMDSPILDDVKSEVLTTEAGSIIDIAGRKYVAVDDLYALRDAIDEKINTVMAGGISGLASMSERNVEPATVASAQPSSAPPTNTSSEATTVIPTARTNPFGVRMPLATNNANLSLTTATPATTNKSVPAAEPIKAPSTRRPAPFASSTNISSKWGDDQPAVATKNDVQAVEPLKAPATRRPAPFASSTNISSKWGDDQPAVGTKNEVPAVEPVQASGTRRPGPFASKTNISSKWGDDQPAVATKNEVPAVEPAEPSKTSRAAPFTSKTQVASEWASEPARPVVPAAMRRTATSARSLEPIIGDRNVFGHLSEEARRGQQYTPPHKAPNKRNVRIQPGDGYKMLLEQITGLKVADTIEK